MIFLLAIMISLSSSAEVIDRVYATVNDEMISLSDIQRQEDFLRKRAMYEDLLYPDDETISTALKNRSALVEKMISEKLIDSEAKKLGVIVADDRILKDIQSKGGESHLAAMLNQEGYTLKDYKEFLRKSMARKEVVGYFVGQKIKISDDDIMDFYATATKGNSSQGFEYNLSHIVFPFDNPSEKEMALQAAQTAMKALQQGQSFTSLHSKYNPREKDDSFGVFKSGEMLPVIEASLSGLRSGGTSQIVETPLGYHIFKLNSKKVANNPDFEKRKQQIFQFLYTKNYKEQLEYWLNQRRKSAVVKIVGDKVEAKATVATPAPAPTPKKKGKVEKK